MTDETTKRAGGSASPSDPVLATFSDWLDHAVACVDACRRRRLVPALDAAGQTAPRGQEGGGSGAAEQFGLIPYGPTSGARRPVPVASRPDDGGQ